ncbi:hypothetical protein D3C74_366860 [compost metagenome]
MPVACLVLDVTENATCRPRNTADAPESVAAIQVGNSANDICCPRHSPRLPLPESWKRSWQATKNGMKWRKNNVGSACSGKIPAVRNSTGAER